VAELLGAEGLHAKPQQSRGIAHAAASRREFLNESNNFFMREWFVYEPPFAWDGTNIKN
jgi:hypothetical protein